MKTTIRARVRFEMDVDYDGGDAQTDSIRTNRLWLIDVAKRFVRDFANARLIGDPEVLRLTITVEEPDGGK
jgi:hypothetical protein